MMAADQRAIAEVSLLASGFTYAHALAHRCTSVMALCRKRLHPFPHYDFGKRIIYLKIILPFSIT